MTSSASVGAAERLVASAFAGFCRVDEKMIEAFDRECSKVEEHLAIVRCVGCGSPRVGGN
jgi:hypothetical protein